jgi:cellulose synthase/poly-beta-1,6-N-acetylglucosamine synthase-like glycosyltransferase
MKVSLRVGIVAYRSLLPETVMSCLALERAMAPTWQMESGANVEYGRNKVAKELSEDVLLFVDADMAFVPKDVSQLLKALKSDPGRGAVSGCYVRWKDGLPVHNWRNGGSWLGKDDLVEKSRKMRGVHPVDQVGAGLLAISKEAIEALEFPYFESGFDHEYDQFISEDTRFCWKLQAAGFNPSVHFGVQISHIGPTAWSLSN